MKKKVLAELSNLTWLDILREIRSITSKKPDIELALAQVFEQDFLNRLPGKVYAFFSLIRQILGTIKSIRKVRTEKISLPQKGGIFVLNMPRANDFGIIFLIVKECDNRGIPSVLIVTKHCFMSRKEKLLSLKHSKVVIREDIRYMPYSFRKMISTYIIAIKSYRQLVSTVSDKKVRHFITNHNLHFLDTFTRQKKGVDTFESYVDSTCLGFSLSLGTRYIGLFGKRNNIKTYVIQHGHNTEGGISYWNGYTPANNSEIIVFGDIYKKMVDKVYTMDKVIALGNPYYDDKYFSPRQLKSKLHITFFFTIHPYLGKKAILNGFDFVNQYLDFVLKFYEMNKNKTILRIKLHPNSTPEYVLNYNSLFGNEIKIICNKDSFAVFEDTDISVSWSSTIGLESVLAGVLYIQLLLVDRWNFYKYNFAIQMENYNDFAAFIDEIRTHPNKYTELVKNQREKLPQYLSNIGNSAKSIVDYIIKDVKND